MTFEAQFTSTAKLPNPDPEWFCLAATVLWDGSLAILHTNTDVWKRYKTIRKPNGAWNPFEILSGTLGRISILQGELYIAELEFPLIHYPFPLFDRIEPGKWVIGDARSYEDNPPAIIASDKTLTHVDLGFDFIDLVTDGKGAIYAGYSDRGTISSDGPPTDEGIARFTSDGALSHGYNRNLDPQSDIFIACCECLNIGLHGAWAAIWPEYRLIQLDSASRKNFRIRTAAPDALATNGELFLFAQAHGETRHKLTLLELPYHPSSRRLRRVWTGNLEMTLGGPVRKLIGRGDCLHVVTDTAWHQLTIDDLLEQLDNVGSGKRPLERDAFYR